MGTTAQCHGCVGGGGFQTASALCQLHRGPFVGVVLRGVGAAAAHRHVAQCNALRVHRSHAVPGVPQLCRDGPKGLVAAHDGEGRVAFLAGELELADQACADRVEREDGLWIYTLNMDMMVKMGRKLPSPLKEEAQAVRDTIFEMMERASKGEY